MLQKYPLFPYFCAYFLGVLSFSFYKTHQKFWIFLGVTLLLGWISWGSKRSRLTGGLLLLLAFSLGLYRTSISSQSIATAGEPYPGIPQGTQVYEGKVVSYPQRREYGFSYRVRVHAWKKKNSWQPISTTAQISHFDSKAPSKGDLIRFRANLRTPRNAGNDREFNYARYLKVRSIELVGSISSATRWVQMAKVQNSVQRRINDFRSQVLQRAEFYLAPTRFSVFRGLVLGEKPRNHPKVLRTFRSAGVMHLLVVSGFHVGLVAFVFSFFGGWLFRRSAFLVERIPLWHVKAVAAGIGATLFCSFTDLPVPTLRALIGVWLFVLCLMVGRPRDGFAFWIVTAFLILWIQPLFVFDLSTQLSFLAVLGILIAWRLFPFHPLEGSSKLRKIFCWGRSALLITFAAWFFTLPILIFYFSRITLWAPLGNLLIAPTLGGVGIPLALTASVLSGPFSTLGDYLFCVFDGWMGWILKVLFWTENLSGTHLFVPRFFWVGWVSLGILGALLWTWKQNLILRHRWVSLSGIVVLLVTLLLFLNKNKATLERFTKVHFLSVGQGEAVLVISPNKKVALIDTGPGGPNRGNAAQRFIIPWLQTHGLNEIDLMVITHADLDHAGGALRLLDEYPVHEIWLPHDPKSLWLLRIKETLKKEQTRIRIFQSRFEKPIFWQGVQFQPLFGYEPSNSRWSRNNRSLVFQLKVHGFKVFMAGDIEKLAEQKLLQTHANLSADVLKVPHHGSRTSTTESFLRGVRPMHAVISVGWKNRYRHPAEEVLKRLKRHGIRIWRSDRCGEVVAHILPGELNLNSGIPCTDSIKY